MTLHSQQASGVKVDKTVVSFLDRMKMEKGDNRVRLATFKIEEGFIKLDKSVTQLDLDKKGQDGFDAFQNELSECHCRYIVYDCHFATKDSPLKEELVFAMWSVLLKYFNEMELGCRGGKLT